MRKNCRKKNGGVEVQWTGWGWRLGEGPYVRVLREEGKAEGWGRLRIVGNEGGVGSEGGLAEIKELPSAGPI